MRPNLNRVLIFTSRIRNLLALALLCVTGAANAQTEPDQLNPILGQQLQNSEVVSYQLRQYLWKRIPELPVSTTAQHWTDQSRRIRERVLNDVVFHGWPKDWVDARARFENVGTVEEKKGYRIRKLRYEIVPGFQSTAILYEPANLTGRVPAILSFNGHVGIQGKAVEYKQKGCINYARQGMLVLNLEWLGCGELNSPENDHSYAAHLDLVGANGLGLFYLAMRRGMDYLAEHPNVDPTRMGVTGLSGGGWQSIVLGSLDERVTVAIPVAGYSALESSVEHPEYSGDDLEQNATDFRHGQDYATLTAMRAPRPTLLIYNAEDDCCHRAPLVKPYIFDHIRPFFGLFGKQDDFLWHENRDPGTHNYQTDNRIQSYQFLSRHFRLPAVSRETPADTEIKSYGELTVGLSKNNLTILGLARTLAGKIDHAAPTSFARGELKTLVRYSPVSVKHAWSVLNTKNKGLETYSYQFQFNNDLGATGIFLSATGTPDSAPVTVVLNDKGKKSSAADVSDRVNRGEHVLAVDLLFTGDAAPVNPGLPEFAQMLATTGDRPLGMEAAQLIAVVQWVRLITETSSVRMETRGVRSQIEALIASALEPALFDEVIVRDGMRSLKRLLEAPVNYQAAPDLFCLDLYKKVDVSELMMLAQRVKISQP